MKNVISSALLLILLFSSCSFEKRIYRNGFYVDRNEHRQFGEVSSLKPNLTSLSENAIKEPDADSILPKNKIFIDSESVTNDKTEKRIFANKNRGENKFEKINLAIIQPQTKFTAPDPTKEKEKLSDQAQTVLGVGLFALIGALLMFLAITQMGMWLWFGIAFIFIAPIAALVGIILGLIVLSKLKAAKETMPHDKQKASIGFVLSLLGLFLIFFWLVENGDWLSANF